MSVRGYKIKKVVLTKAPSFNLSEHYAWLEAMAVSSNFNNDNECNGIELAKTDVIEAMEQGRIDKTKYEILERILKDFDKNEEYVSYSCY